MKAELRAPVDVQIELTQACNQACRHCYNFWRFSKKKRDSIKSLSELELKHIVAELTRNNVFSATITGGEPFLQKKALFTLVQMLEKAGIRVSINTNFSLVEKKDIIELCNNSQVSVLVSLLSANPDEHARLAGISRDLYFRVVDNISLALHHKIPLSLNMVLLRENLHGIRDVARLAKNLGVHTFCATKALPNNQFQSNDYLLSSEEVIWSLLELIDIERAFDLPVEVLGCYPKCLLVGTEAYKRFFHRVCVAGKTTATIGADGKVRPCPHAEISYGNILTEPLSDIWKKMSGWRKGEFVPEKCRNCTILDWCTGSCRFNSLLSGLENMDIHASPDNLKSFSTQQIIPVVSGEESLVPSKVFVSPNVEFRDESFGSLLFRRDRWAIILVNKSAADFLKNKRNGKCISFDSFLKKSGAVSGEERQSVKNLYVRLFKKGMLVSP